MNSSFYDLLQKHSGIDTGIISNALSLFDGDTVFRLWQLFTKDAKLKSQKIPYFSSGFYPYEFYGEMYRLAKEKQLSNEGAFLYIYVLFAQRSYELYANAGLQKQIFFDSFRRISEYVKEYAETKGTFGIFDYHFAANHVIGSVVRLGAFEYSYGKFKGKKAINVHVPQKADLSAEKRYHSYRLAKQYFGNHPIIAESWLLYPEHKKMLSENSKILDFARDFDIISVEESYDYKELFHVFGRRESFEASDLPSETSLQRAYLQRIKEKAPVGSAVGVLNIKL